MTTSSAAPTPRKKRSIGKIIGLVLCILILPLIVGYFVATSAVFFKKVILPRAGASMNSTITVADAKISPFSQIVLTKIQVTPNGKETLFKADEIRARYSLMDIIKGKITVSEATVISPVITIVEAPDGSNNLDPITKSENPSAEQKKKEEKKSEKPANLNIQNISLKNAFLQKTKNLPGGGHEITEISNLNFSIDRLANGQPGKMNMAADVRMENVPSANSTNGVPGSMRGKLTGNFDYKLTADIQPESAKGNLRFDISEGRGQMADLAKLAAIIDCDLTPAEIRQLSLHFDQSGQRLGEFRASGPFSFANTEGKLKVELSSIDRRVLNLVGAASGFDFNSTTINSSNEIAVSQKGNAISVTGQLNANSLSLTKKAEKKTTPTLELLAAYQINVDQNAKSALIQKFDLNGTQNQQKILSASISKPMPISWGGTSGAPENATLQLAITDLNLADWKAFAGEAVPSGKLNTTLDIISQQAGKHLSLNITSRIDNLSATFGSNQISQADLLLHTHADIAEMQKISLSDLQIEMAQSGQPALQLKSSGTLDLKSSDADLKISLDGKLAQLFKLVVVPDLAASAGAVKFDGQITQRKEVKTVKGDFVVTDFSGSYAGSPLDRFGAKFAADLEMNQQDLRIRKLSGDLQQAGQSGGNLDMKGNYNSEKKTGELEMKIVNLNQNALGPFLAKSLGEKQLITISIDGNTTAYLQENSSSFKGNIDLKNFVVRDPKKSKPDAPIAAQVQLDGAMREKTFDLKQFQVTLSPTARAKNQLNITGQLDTSKTNAMKGKLLVQSDAFDVTPFYDLYAAQPQPTNAAAPAQSTPPPTKPNAEPEPMQLPIEQVTVDINIGQFYLREIEIKDWRATTKIEGSRVLLNPFQLSLNGAPVKMDADLNLGVKGYAYDFSASLNSVPLEPLANSFMPDRKGAYKGTIIANAKIKGAGTTGVTLKTTLGGQVGLTFTNADIQVAQLKNKSLLVRTVLVPIALLLQIPEIENTPIHWVDARIGFADGKINISNLVAVSDSYRGTVQASVPIADVLKNSPLNKIPVGFELRKGLAEKARLGGGTVSADGNYVKLPNLINLVGTLGDPKSDTDKKGLATLTLQAGGGIIGGQTGNVLKGLGGLLGGGQGTATSNTNPPSSTNVTTNQPSANEQLINNALDFFKKKKK